MAFIWPVMLTLLPLIPLGVVLYVRMRRQRAQQAARLGSLGFTHTGGGRPLGARRHIPPALFFTGLALLLIGLARPQTVVSLPRAEGTVILTFDVSGSMTADDVAPNRMEAAKATARALVERKPPGIRIGIVAFSESGLAVQAPTHDETALFAAINRISPQRGTSLGQGILAALTTITGGVPGSPEAESIPPPGTSAAIVLLTDGENTAPPNPLEAAQLATDLGVRIFPIGVGSAEGATIQIEGFTVHSQLDEAMLQALADLTAGTYYGPSNQQELATIYDALSLQLVVEPEKTEVTALFAGAGILALLIGGICSMLWFSRIP